LLWSTYLVVDIVAKVQCPTQTVAIKLGSLPCVVSPGNQLLVWPRMGEY
jgi:hypothetical protein